MNVAPNGRFRTTPRPTNLSRSFVGWSDSFCIYVPYAEDPCTEILKRLHHCMYTIGNSVRIFRLPPRKARRYIPGSQSQGRDLKLDYVVSRTCPRTFPKMMFFNFQLKCANVLQISRYSIWITDTLCLIEHGLQKFDEQVQLEANWKSSGTVDLDGFSNIFTGFSEFLNCSFTSFGKYFVWLHS